MGKKHKKHHKKPVDPKDKLEEPPIKLVLKVGSSEKAPQETKVKERDVPTDAQRPKEHSTKRKKKKRSSSKDRKKRKHVDGVEDQGFDSSSTVESTQEKPKKKAKIEERKNHDGKHIITKIHIKPIEPPNRERETKRPKPQDFHDKEPSPVLLCLANLHQTLQRKDTNGFFAYPVNDVIAPGYSSIITNPMDFSTMKLKIDIHAYTSLEEFRDDFNVMCNNAMIYNTAETIYFKAAKKLQQTGAKIMSAEKFRNLYRAMGLAPPEETAVSGRQEDEVIDVDTVDGSTTPLLPTPRKKENKPKKRNTVGQRIQAKAEEAARKAAEKLAAKYPNSNIGFLRKDADGNTSLAILNPCSVDGPQSIPVNLGAVTGKLTAGSLSSSLFQDDKKNKAWPVNYLKYGPFCSFSPTFDSSMATITKEDSDLLHSTYGDSTGAYYAHSLQAFVKDNLFAKDYADRLLDALTDGAHSKLMDKLQKQLEEEEKKERIKEENEKAAKKEVVEEKKTLTELSASDVDALLSLEKDGIDMSFLKPKATKSDETKDVQKNLDKTADLINKLDAVQTERLSQASKDANGRTPKAALTPSESEQQIAEKVTQELRNLTSKVKPKDVVDNESVRKATGVGDVSEILRKEKDQDEMEVQLAAEAIETVFNEATTMEDLDKVIWPAARDVEDAMGLDVLDELTASLDDVKQMDGI